MECNFSLKHYKEMLEKGKRLGYLFSKVSDIHMSKINKFIILRHDVDFSVERALEIAKIEHKLGIHSTFFIRVHNYNPFEFNNYVAIRKIIKMGHEIGLHYEGESMSKISGESDNEIYIKEINVLETIFDIQIKNTTKHVDFDGIKVKPILNSQCFKYLSDSLGNWRDGCLCKHLGKVKKLHVMTHPKYWYKKNYHLK